jgi:hypothetical protein
MVSGGQFAYSDTLLISIRQQACPRPAAIWLLRMIILRMFSKIGIGKKSMARQLEAESIRASLL